MISTRRVQWFSFLIDHKIKRDLLINNYYYFTTGKKVINDQNIGSLTTKNFWSLKQGSLKTRLFTTKIFGRCFLFFTTKIS